MIIACAALYQIADSDAGELACLAVNPEYRHGRCGDELLERHAPLAIKATANIDRSEERRVGKECRAMTIASNPTPVFDKPVSLASGAGQRRAGP